MQSLEQAKRIIYILEEKGYKAYLVGGCVRDMMMGITPSDYDITTSARPEEVEEIFQKTFPTGKQYGTILVMINNNGYEVTTFRHDVEYLDGRRPECVDFSLEYKDDAARRDFTINAMAMDSHGEIIDYFGGQEDIRNRIVRCVGHAEERFREDQLRKIRAIRFACQKGFSLDHQIKLALERDASLASVSMERYREELMKILHSRQAARGIEWLNAYGMLLGNERTYSWDGLSVLDCLIKDDAILLAGLSLVTGIAFEEKLKLSKQLKREIITLKLAYHHELPKDDYEARVFLSEYLTLDMKKLSNLLYTLGQLEHEEEFLGIIQSIDISSTPLSIKDLAINGNDIKKLGYHGAVIKNMLEESLLIVLREPNLNDKDYLLERIHKK